MELCSFCEDPDRRVVYVERDKNFCFGCKSAFFTGKQEGYTEGEKSVRLTGSIGGQS